MNETKVHTYMPVFVSPSRLAQLLGVTPQAVSMRLVRGSLTPDAYAETADGSRTPLWTVERAKRMTATYKAYGKRWEES
jgi:hypothetical protein